MIEYWKAGGVYMWPLLGCIIMGAVFIIERIITFTLARINAKKFVADIKTTIKEKGIDGGIEFCKNYRAPLARIIENTLSVYKKSGPYKEALEEAATRSGLTELAFLDRGLNILVAVSTIAPIIGFLGTVSGMINAFQAVAIAGEIEPTLVASGISEALITTATGLTIAFPVVAFHVYFTTKSNNYTMMIENSVRDIISFLMEEKP